jgi:membrane-associated phospholipid phosphatase
VWSLSFLQALENLRSPVTNGLMGGASWLGSEEAYLLLGVVVYLCLGHRFGFHLIAMFLVSVFINTELKLAFGTPRPFVAHPADVHPLWPQSAGGFSFPSGHAQTAAAVWGLLAVYARSRRLKAALVAVVLLVGFSRLYLQVHWPVDVLGGWLIGAVMLGAYLLILGAWHGAQPQVPQPASVALLALAAGIMYAAGHTDDSSLRAAGTLLGAGLGFVLLESRGGYDARGSVGEQVMKVVTALALLLAVRHGAKLLLPPGPVWTAARYALVGFTLTFALPALLQAVRVRATPGRG